MKCETHETEMEWVETGVEEAGGGYWYCEQCQEEEEAWLEGQLHVGSEPEWSDDDE